MIDPSLIPEVKVIECMNGNYQQLCTQLGHNLHELMPPRIKITAPRGVDEEVTKEPRVYSYTSPIRAEWVMRKLMKFTVPVSVIPYRTQNETTLRNDLEKFDDVRLHNNVIYALETTDQRIAELYYKLADDYRERFYFFNWIESGD